MILSRPDILKYIEENRLRFDPKIKPDQIAQVSIDLHLGHKFTVFKDPQPPFIDAVNIDSSLWDSRDMWRHSEEQSNFRLDPGGFVLAQTLERVYIPPDLVGLVEGRSSWARMGISVHVTSPKIDPGFEAPITLEMTNLGRLSINLRAGIDRPAQLMLVTLSLPLPEGEEYGTGPDDTFQHQVAPIPHKP